MKLNTEYMLKVALCIWMVSTLSYASFVLMKIFSNENDTPQPCYNVFTDDVESEEQ